VPIPIPIPTPTTASTPDNPTDAAAAAAATATPPTHLRVGERCVVGGPARTKCIFGVVRFVGTVHFAQGFWVGVELDKAVGKPTHDGTVEGRRYFGPVGLGKGVFVRAGQITLTRPLVDGVSAVNVLKYKISQSLDLLNSQLEIAEQAEALALSLKDTEKKKGSSMGLLRGDAGNPPTQQLQSQVSALGSFFRFSTALQMQK
jgi:hypothetical protein